MSGDSVAFYEPGTASEAAAILARVPDARCLAGGQTLVAGIIRAVTARCASQPAAN